MFKKLISIFCLFSFITFNTPRSSAEFLLTINLVPIIVTSVLGYAGYRAYEYYTEVPPKLKTFFFDNLSFETKTEFLMLGHLSSEDEDYSANISLKYAPKRFYNFHPYLNVNTTFKEHQVQAGVDYFVIKNLKAYVELALRHTDPSVTLTEEDMDEENNMAKNNILVSAGMMYRYQYKKVSLYLGTHYEMSPETKLFYFMPYAQVSFPVFKSSEVYLMSSLNKEPELKLAYQFIF